MNTLTDKQMTIRSVGYGLVNSGIYGIYFETDRGVSHILHLPNVRLRVGGHVLLDEPGAPPIRDAKEAAEKLKVPYAGQYHRESILGHANAEKPTPVKHWANW
jgi:hypothetical protein